MGDAGAEPVKAVAAAAAPAKEAEIDLWGDEEEGGESYEESVARKKKEAEEKKAKKKKAAPIAKSSILYSIKPACFDGDDDDEDGGGVADLGEMEAFVRGITMKVSPGVRPRRWRSVTVSASSPSWQSSRTTRCRPMTSRRPLRRTRTLCNRSRLTPSTRSKVCIV